ncbi:MAG TPA: hypothetical protein VFI50_05935, partial [Casimicrobiaceae bacterium]|nr:hypothetical protein [Casimicrobiaceae bacterium]
MSGIISNHCYDKVRSELPFINLHYCEDRCMRKHSLTRFWVWCVGALIALVSTATIATTTVPLRATIGFTEQVGAPSFGCALTGTIDGFGTAGKLGALHLTSTDCINP